MTNKQSKGHWWIVENMKDIRISPKSRYLDICFIIGGLLELDDSQKSSVLPSIIQSGKLTKCQCIKPDAVDIKICLECNGICHSV